MKLTFSTGGALAALAAALALAAVPAGARENDRHDDRGRHQQASTDNGQRGQHGGDRHAGGREQASARPERPATPQGDRGQRNWSQQARPQQQQRNGTPEARPQQQQRNWTQQARPQPRSYTPQAQQTQRWGSTGQRTERNGTYRDRDRSTTYGSRGGNDRNWRDGNRDSRQWDRNWRGNNRYDWQRYRSTNRNAYHIGRYYSPYRNYSYRRLSIGFGLDSLFYSNRYWINDPWQYRLPEAYGPYRWVRYYDDALLVDIYSGEVVDVIYDFFW